VVADLMDMYGNYIGRVEYKHSTLTVGEGSSSAINARATGYWNQRVGIAETITPAEDLATCTNLGAHLHQNTSFGSWGKYDGYPNEDGARGFPVTSRRLATLRTTRPGATSALPSDSCVSNSRSWCDERLLRRQRPVCHLANG
jgi:hypothetical protein